MTANTKRIGDIDIDMRDRNTILSRIDHIPAKKTDGSKHSTGVYLQDIEIDPLTGYAEENYENTSFTKIDFLNLTSLKYFRSNYEIKQLMAQDPNWDLLKIREIVKKLPQIHDHFELVKELEPKTVMDLVDVLHKIRETSKYKFKKSHAVAYALNIVVMMNYFAKTNIVPD